MYLTMIMVLSMVAGVHAGDDVSQVLFGKLYSL